MNRPVLSDSDRADLVEIVARAMCIDNGDDPDFPIEEGRPQWSFWVREAWVSLAAIEGAGLAIVPRTIDNAASDLAAAKSKV